MNHNTMLYKYSIKRTREFGRGLLCFFLVSFVYFGGILNIYLTIIPFGLVGNEIIIVNSVQPQRLSKVHAVIFRKNLSVHNVRH